MILYQCVNDIKERDEDQLKLNLMIIRKILSIKDQHQEERVPTPTFTPSSQLDSDLSFQPGRGLRAVSRVSILAPDHHPH